MDKDRYQQPGKDYKRIEKALHHAAENFRDQPSLAALADSVHLSEHHFQRIFCRWAGVSPKQFLQYLTVQHARECLASDMTVLDTAYDSGLSAPARLYELFVRLESLTPAEYKSAGAGLQIDYGFHSTPFGECLIGVTRRGITHLSFCDAADSELDSSSRQSDFSQSELSGQDKSGFVEKMKSRLPNASYSLNSEATFDSLQRVFSGSSETDQSLALLVSGSAFQLKVWEALLRVKRGSLISYQQLAACIDRPQAMRAVGTAVGQNPVAFLIPCHRVIRSNGMLGQYHWGIARKLAIQGWEHASISTSVAVASS